MAATHRDNSHALSFGKAAEDYERGRPTYPADAIRWILSRADSAVVDGADRPLDVVDVGAGTGKFTAALLAAEPDRVMRVVAVEPDDVMRDKLTEVVPGATALAGTGEALPLDADSVDLVSFAQAWHWVDPRATALEVARVLRADGAAAIVWNIRDDSVDWVARLGEIMGASAAEQYNSTQPDVGDALIRTEYAEFHWVQPMTRERFFAMVTSRSYVIAMTDGERATVLDGLATLLDTHPALAGQTEYPMPYVTRVTIARPASSVAAH